MSAWRLNGIMRLSLEVWRASRLGRNLKTEMIRIGLNPSSQLRMLERRRL